MRPSELKDLMIRFIRARMPLLIKGAPGVGKTDIVLEAATEAGADVLLSHPVVEDQTDAKGLPWFIDGKATFVPFGHTLKAIEADRPTVWFLDDLGQASPSVQASYMQWLLARELNGHQLSDHVTFIAATNRRTDRAAVSGILEPVKSRFNSIVELDAHLDDWCNWALDHNVKPELIAFLRFKPDLLSAFAPTADISNSPVPRTWSHVNKVLGLGLTPAIQHTAICGAVGDGAGVECSAFLKLYAELPNIDALLVDPNSAAIPTNPAVLYALSGALAHRTTPQNATRVAQFIERLCTANRDEFGMLIFRDALKRDEQRKDRKQTLMQTEAWIRLAAGSMGKLASGV